MTRVASGVGGSVAVARGPKGVGEGKGWAKTGGTPFNQCQMTTPSCHNISPKAIQTTNVQIKPVASKARRSTRVSFFI